MAPAAARPGPKKFSELDCISQPTLDVITSLGFHTTTPVQEATIPLFCGNKDVAVDACTGSGKTLAFAVPVVERLRKLEEPLKTHQVGAIIISPTRELAKQIYGVAEPFIASVPGLTAMLLVGGTDPAADVSAFKARGGHVLIGTPGRIDDIIKRCTAMDLRRLEVLVLDEADRLLDMGFKAQLDSVMGRLPKQRRTGLFSATQTEAVQELARAGLRNPVRVNVAVAVAHPPKQQPEDKGAKGSSKGSKDGGKGKGQQAEDDLDADVAGEAAAAAAAGAGADVEGVQKTPNSLSISYVVCEADEKIPQLVRFLRIHGPQRKVIVYGMTCAAVDHLAAVLPRLPQLRGRVVLRALHGKMKQAARERELEAFRAMPAGVLLCTDLAARGLDIPDVHWIVQLDPPQDPAAFVHRVGRTARMGRAGSALVLLMPHEGTYVEFLRLRKVPMTEGTPLTPEDVPEDEPAASPAAAGGGAARGGAASTSGRGGGGGTAAAASKGSAAGAAGAGVSSAGTGSGDVLAALRRAAETDRDVMDKATRSFVTYIRGYKEHHCKFIFRVQDLNVGRLASGLGLLRLPRMPDLRKPLGAEEFVPSPVDPATVPYKDKAREKQRQKALQAKAAEAARNGDAAAAGRKRKAAAAAAPAAAEGEARLTAAKRRQLQAIDEAANLNQEYTLLKKLKRGKITQHQFNVAMGLSSDSEAEAGDDDEDKGGKQQQQQGQGQQRAGGAVGGGSDDDDDGGASDGEGEGGGSSGDEDGGEGGRAEGRTGGGAGGSGARGKLAAGGRQHGKGRGKRQQGGGAGAAAGRTQKALGLRQPQGALQSYMQKKARKQKKKKAKRAASGTGGA